MDIHAPRLSALEVFLLFGWWTLVLVSGFVYGHDVAGVFSTHTSVCTTRGIGATLRQAAQPHYWFGLATLIATAAIYLNVFRRLTSRWAWLADNKWHLLWVSVCLLLLVPLTGCH